jgi:hypothetical protein
MVSLVNVTAARNASGGVGEVYWRLTFGVEEHYLDWSGFSHAPPIRVLARIPPTDLI